MRTGIRGLVLVVVMLAASHADAAIFGTVSGAVVDPQGHAVAQVHVTISAPSSGWQGTADTDVDGRYVLKAVPAGNYVISSVKPGFETIEIGKQRRIRYIHHVKRSHTEWPYQICG